MYFFRDNYFFFRNLYYNRYFVYFFRIVFFVVDELLFCMDYGYSIYLVFLQGRDFFWSVFFDIKFLSNIFNFFIQMFIGFILLEFRYRLMNEQFYDYSLEIRIYYIGSES